MLSHYQFPVYPFMFHNLIPRTILNNNFILTDIKKIIWCVWSLFHFTLFPRSIGKEATVALVHDDFNAEEYLLQVSLAVAADNLQKIENLASGGVLLLESCCQSSCRNDGLFGGDEVIVCSRLGCDGLCLAPDVVVVNLVTEVLDKAMRGGCRKFPL